MNGYERRLKYEEGMRLKARGDNKAAACFKAAADEEFLDKMLLNKGLPEAQYELANLIEIGKGIGKIDSEAFKYYLMAAEQGHKDAQVKVGYYFENGKGVDNKLSMEERLKKAFIYYKRAARQEQMSGQYNLGLCYEFSKGVKLNLLKAVSWYQCAANQGMSAAKNRLGYCYEHGKGVDKELKLALDNYQAAANAGIENAQYAVGLLYDGGKVPGVGKNTLLAIHYFRLAADQGHKEAQLKAANLLNNKINKNNSDIKDASIYFRLAADQGVAKAQLETAFFYRSGHGAFNQNAQKAFEYFKMAADQFDDEAEFEVGHCFHFGNGVKRDIKQAMEYYQRAIDHGNNPNALCNLGVCYGNTNDVPVDLKKAVEYYQRSADLGCAQGKVNLGIYIENGKAGLAKDMARAVALYREGADLENAAGQYNLGRCYEEGIGIAKDLKLALENYELAAKQNHAAAKDCLKRLKEVKPLVVAKAPVAPFSAADLLPPLPFVPLAPPVSPRAPLALVAPPALLAPPSHIATPRPKLWNAKPVVIAGPKAKVNANGNANANANANVNAYAWGNAALDRKAGFDMKEAMDKNGERKAAFDMYSFVGVINSKDFTLIEEKKYELGEGGFGKVFKGTWKNCMKPVAIKKFFVKWEENADHKEIANEIRIMGSQNCPNLVQLYGYCLNPYCLIMEYMPQGSLYKLLRSGKALNVNIKINIAYGMAKGLAYLHAKNIIHRDIKSLNVLIDDNFEAKLGDFGIAKVKGGQKTSTHSTKAALGTTNWMAPELFTKKNSISKASDVYSFGITLWELVSHELPHKDIELPGAVIAHVIGGGKDPIPAGCDPKLSTVIEACRTKEPELRPDAEAVVDFFASKENNFVTFLQSYKAYKGLARGLVGNFGNPNANVNAIANGNANANANPYPAPPPPPPYSNSGDYEDLKLKAPGGL